MKMGPKSPFFRPSHPHRQAWATSLPAAEASADRPASSAAANQHSDAGGGAAAAAEEHKSSVLGTAANLVNAIIGCGIVGIPYAMAQCGIAAGVPLVLFVAVLTEKSLRLLIETAAYVQAGSYETLAESCFGRLGFRFVAMNMFITSYGAMVAYLMIVKDCFAGLLLAGHEEYNTATVRRSLLLVISLATVVPLACRRDMADLAVTSRLNVLIDTTIVAIVAVNAVLYRHYLRQDVDDNNSLNSINSTAIAILYQKLTGENVDGEGIEGGATDGSLGSISSIPSNRPLGPLWGVQGVVHWQTIFVGLGVMSFAFVCQHAAFIIAGSLQQPRQWSTVTRLALGACALLALACGIFGFYGYRDDTKGNVLDNLHPNAASTHLAKLLLGTTMLFVYPLESMVARHVCVTLLFDGRAAHEGNHDAYLLQRRDRRVLLTLAVYVAAIVPAALFDDLGPVLALTGAIGGSCLSYIGPGAVFLGVHGARFRALVRQSWWRGQGSGDSSTAATFADAVTATTYANAEPSTIGAVVGKEPNSVTLSIRLHGEQSPLLTPNPLGPTKHQKDTEELMTLQPLSVFGRLLWIATGMPLWLWVADLGGQQCTSVRARSSQQVAPSHSHCRY
jgi:solute carrier family 38 (sodium-coupled neutral amino acid transporter), member 11